MTGPGSLDRASDREKVGALLSILVGALVILVAFSLWLGSAGVASAQTPPTITASDTTPTGGNSITLTLNSDTSYAQLRWDGFCGAQWGPMTTETECVLVSQSGNTATVIYAADSNPQNQAYRACWRQSTAEEWDCAHEEALGYFVNVSWAAGDQPTPAQVAGVTATGDSNALNLSWTAVADADEYHVQWRTSGGTFGATDQEIVTGNSAAIDGLTSGTLYSVRVAARLYAAGTTDADPGIGAWSATATATPSAVPPAGPVTGVTATATATGASIAVSWTAAQNADGYKVRWKSGSESFDAGRQLTTTATAQTITGLRYGTTYDVQVIATRAGAADGTASATESATIDDLALAALDTTGLAFDVLALVEAGGDATFYATAERGGPTGSLLDGELGLGTDDAAITRIRARGGNALGLNHDTADFSLSDYTGTGGAGEDLRALLMDETGAVGTSTGISASGGGFATFTMDTTGQSIVGGLDDGDRFIIAFARDATLEAPAQVTGVVATAASESRISVTWNAAANADGYSVRWGTTTGVYTDSATTAGTTHTIADLEPSTQYFIQVTATRTGAPDGDASAEASATTQAPAAPAQVTGVVATATSDTAIEVSWDPADRADGYVIQWGTTSGSYTDRATTTTTSHGISGLNHSTQYFIQGTATRAGAANGQSSAEASATTQAPGAPGRVTGVAAAAASTSSIDVSWNAAANADGYRVEWGTMSGSYPDSDITAGTSFTITGLTENTDYHIVVIATRTGAADGQSSAEASATTDKEAPARVTGVVATATSDSSISVSWETAVRAEVYVVSWGTTSGSYTDSDTASSTSFAISGLNPSTRYFIQVYATRAGTANGQASAEASATTQPPAAPARVTGVNAAAASSSAIDVSWDPATNADGYRIEWGTTSGNYTDNDTTAGTSFTITGLQYSTDYFIRVIATRTGASDGQASAEATASTGQLDPPDQVAGVTATAVSASVIDVSWNVANNADGYVVQWRGPTNSWGDHEAAVSGADTTSYSITGLQAASEYRVRVVATRTGAANGQASSPDRTATAPEMVTGVSANADDHERITVAWTAVAGADGYTVQWKSATEAWGDHQATASASPYVITNLNEDTTYSARVIATLTGAPDGQPSAAAAAKTALQPPARVAGLTATAVSDAEIALSWSMALRAGVYVVQWRESGQSFEASRRAATTTLRHTVRGLSPNTRYFFQVIATRAGAPDGPASAVADARTDAALTPHQVTGVTVTLVSDREVMVGWVPARHATSYVVEWDTDPAFPNSQQATVSGTGVIIERLRAETEYHVRVQGTRAGATTGAYSTYASATTGDAQTRVWAERFPGGAIAAQLALSAFGGVMAGVRFKSMKSPRREAVITGAMSLGALILPAFGLANEFWVIGVALLVLLASIAAIFLARR